MHWTVDFNAFGVASLERAQIRVYALDPSGARRFLGNATDTGTAPTSSRFQYEVESVAPRYALTDRDGYGYEPWQGWTRLEFDIYAQHGHALLATIGAWSDIPMIDNYPGHFCAE
jgi:hypothetical protein